MKASKAVLFAILAAALAAFLAGCAGAPKPVPVDLPAQVLVQRAQEASDSYDYATALSYYQALKERYGEDPAYLCAAEYEMAFIAYKEERFADATAGFKALLERYAGPDAAAYPQRYRILALKVLESIEARTSPTTKK